MATDKSGVAILAKQPINRRVLLALLPCIAASIYYFGWRSLAMITWAHHKEQDYCPSIHMPKWATRTWKELLEIRAERIQDITEQDARAEGVKAKYVGGHITLTNQEYYSYRAAFVDLWNHLNGKRGYGMDTNPYVWVLVYKILSTTGRPLDREED